jgi:hypothetical protein
MNYLELLEYEPPVAKKWQEVFVKMRVHTQGYSPDHIFKSRRPNASLDPAELNYRKENFRAITKSLFDAAIDAYQECALLLDVSISSDEAKEIENTVKMYDGLKQMELRQWWIKKPSSYRQTDPNAVVVVLPKHPSEKLIPSFEFEIPNFNNVINSKIEVDIRLIPTYQLIHIDQESVVFKAGKWKYKIDKDKEYWEDYYFALDKEFTYLIYPVKEKNSFKYEQVPYYKNDLKVAPAVVIGGRQIIEECDSGSLEYYIADLAGAAEWGDKCYGQDSDLQICETRFTYIEKWIVNKKCEQVGSEWYNGLHCSASDHMACGGCHGTGWLKDQSPMGTHFIEKSDGFNDNGEFIAPVGYIAPPPEILQHSADRTTHYYDKTQAELGILKQNMTEQSGVSKAFDIAQKVTLITNIVYDIYRGYEHLLNICQGYLYRRSDTVITLPEDFDVKNANDLGVELAEMKKNGASHNDLVEQNKRVMLKKYGDSDFNRWAQDVLARYDKLYPYSLTEVRDAKAVFGSDLTLNDINLHYFGYQILKDLYSENESVIKSTDVLAVLMDRLKEYAPAQIQIPDFA